VVFFSRLASFTVKKYSLSVTLSRAGIPFIKKTYDGINATKLPYSARSLRKKSINVTLSRAKALSDYVYVDVIFRARGFYIKTKRYPITVHFRAQGFL